tara:strand:+ start:5003 stop:5674 length:672 start_codon:yes stop_codon:yes gene_type:complete
MQKLLFILFLFLQFILNAQSLKDGMGFYREDQIYIGLSFLSLDSNNKSFSQRGLSNHFQLGFVRDIPLISSGKLSIGIGLGYSFQNYNSNLTRFNIDNKNSIFIVNNTLNQKSKLSFNFIEFPISLRWRNSSLNDYQFWRVYAGIKFQRNFLSKLKYSIHDIKNISNEVKNWNKDLYLSFGYNTWNFYFSYGLNQIMKNIRDQYSNKSFRVRPLKIGLIFYLL